MQTLAGKAYRIEKSSLILSEKHSSLKFKKENLQTHLLLSKTCATKLSFGTL
jgi:hypothetical protein